MCIEAIQAVIEQTTIQGPPYTLLLVIAESVNRETGKWRNGMARLANRAHMSRSTAFRCLGELRAAGLVIVTQYPGRASEYGVACYQPDTRPETGTGPEIGTGNGDFTRPETGTGVSQFRDGGVSTVTHEPDIYRTLTKN